MSNPDLKTKPTAARTIHAETLTIWRERMGYPLNDAAEALGIDAATLQDYEAGHRPVPIYIGLAMAALAMDLSPFGDDKSAA